MKSAILVIVTIILVLLVLFLFGLLGRGPEQPGIEIPIPTLYR